MKNVCCYFDNKEGVVYVMCNNGVHPDRQGHHSALVAMTRENFNRACKERTLFNEALGIDVTQGWQTALKNALSNAQNLKDLGPMVAAKQVIDANVAMHGEEAIADDIAKIKEHNDRVQAELERAVKAETESAEPEVKYEGDDETGTETGTAKGRKKSRGSVAD